MRTGIALVLAGLAACSASGPVGYDAPESVLHDVAADVYLVSNVHGAPLAKDNNGYISRVDPGLRTARRHWIQGGRDGVTLHAPRGMAIHGDTLWVTDIDVVRRFDRVSGEPRGEVAIPGASRLDGCAVAPDGVVYCTDSGLDASFAPSGTDAIWRIDGEGQPTALFRGEQLGHPTGIVARDAGVYIVGWRDGTFYQVDGKGRLTVLGKAPEARLDGLVRVGGKGYYTTSWDGECVYRFGITGACEALSVRLQQPAGLGLDAGRGRLLVPLFGSDAIEHVALE